MDAKNTPRFLIIKRHAMSGKIERVAPKGKIQNNESPQQAALREVSEEVGISSDKLVIESKIGATSLRSSHEFKGGMDKDITYFLMHYHGDPADVRVQPVEGYLGIFKRATLEEATGLIYYKNMREIFTLAHAAIGQQQVKKDFLNRI
ncbi:NUDIX domain-containing protein [Patescibacteria group bacterium]|nr:NUDIX domain-containing protein [Patescibacteria group bacterium]